MFANMTQFIVCGGNDDFKEFYDYSYLFDVRYPTKPTAITRLPVKM